MEEKEITRALHALIQQTARIAAQVDEMHAELEEFRPLLAAFKPGNGTSDLQRAGLLRAMRRAARSG